MNLWKPIALCSIAGLVLCLGTQVSSAGGACNDQKNMYNALTSLKAAKGWLDAAEHDKGGWRAAAIEKTNAAIAQTEKGCAYASGR
jgi:hypothetical protein